MPIRIECANQLGVFITKKKRIKIIVGGRASTKSTFASDYVLSKVSGGQTWCCGREFQNSIEDSVHALLTEEIERCEFEGFDVLKTEITHSTGGRIFYKGLARNIASIKSVLTNGLWIEEGETLSANTIKVLTASIRVSAGKAKKAREAKKDIDIPEILITMNRGSSKDAASQSFLKVAEPQLAKTGYYEDENMMILQLNYNDIPKQWFLDSGLETERASDEKSMSTAEYDHKWFGAYSDTIDNAIIKPEWFDACVDAHIKLGFKPLGQEKVSFDPADVGDDPEALAYMHGNVVLQAMSADVKAIDDACDWATDFANQVQADVFQWDCDGMGIGLKRQVSIAFKGKKVTTDQFKGSEGPINPKQVYQPLDNEQAKPKTNEQTFINQRAQWYYLLRDRMMKTWMAVTKGKFIDPDELISFSNDILHLATLRAELCRIPRKLTGGTGRLRLLTKAEMLALDIPSPNIGDSVMMLMKPVDIHPHAPIRLTPPKWG